MDFKINANSTPNTEYIFHPTRIWRLNQPEPQLGCAVLTLNQKAGEKRPDTLQYVASLWNASLLPTLAKLKAWQSMRQHVFPFVHQDSDHLYLKSVLQCLWKRRTHSKYCRLPAQEYTWEGLQRNCKYNRVRNPLSEVVRHPAQWPPAHPCGWSQLL